MTPTAHVVRDGVVKEIAVAEVVLDDVLNLSTGDQVPIDGEVLETRGLEANESLLTGESRPVRKTVGDEVLSGLLDRCRLRHRAGHPRGR